MVTPKTAITDRTNHYDKNNNYYGGLTTHELANSYGIANSDPDARKFMGYWRSIRARSSQFMNLIYFHGKPRSHLYMLFGDTNIRQMISTNLPLFPAADFQRALEVMQTETREGYGVIVLFSTAPVMAG